MQMVFSVALLLAGSLSLALAGSIIFLLMTDRFGKPRLWMALAFLAAAAVTVGLGIHWDRTEGGGATEEPVTSATEVTEEPVTSATGSSDSAALVTPAQDEPTQDVTAELESTGAGESTTIYYLTDLDSGWEWWRDTRTGGCFGGCTGFDTGPARMNGEVLSETLHLKLGGSGGRSTAQYTVHKSCRELRAMVGAREDSPSTTLTFEVSLDDGEYERLAVLDPGEYVDVTVPLDEVHRFKLSSNISGTEVDDRAIALWGDVRVVCRPHSLDPIEK